MNVPNDSVYSVGEEVQIRGHFTEKYNMQDVNAVPGVVRAITFHGERRGSNILYVIEGVSPYLGLCHLNATNAISAISDGVD